MRYAKLKMEVVSNEDGTYYVALNGQIVAGRYTADGRAKDVAELETDVRRIMSAVPDSVIESDLIPALYAESGRRRLAD